MKKDKEYWYDPYGHLWISEDAYLGHLKIMSGLLSNKKNTNPDVEVKITNNSGENVYVEETTNDSSEKVFNVVIGEKSSHKQPSHTEICTKWWYIPEAECWGRVVAYKNHRYSIAVISEGAFKDIDIIKRYKEAFMFYKASDLPEE